MLQQTRMEVVLGYYERFLARFPTVADLARASIDDVTAAWSGLGYYRRARMLRDGAIDVMTRFSGTIPKSVDKLMTIAGIGRYTAGAIASIAYGRRAPIVDGNVARIMARLFAIEAPLASAGVDARGVAACRGVGGVVEIAARFQSGLMELGALICTPRNPSCGRCPIRSHCAAFLTGRVDALRGRRPSRPPASCASRSIWSSTGTAACSCAVNQASSCAACSTPARRHHAADRHAATHRRLVYAGNVPPHHHQSPDHLRGLRRIAPPRTRAREYAWIDPAALAAIPHPSYVRKALRLAGIGK